MPTPNNDFNSQHATTLTPASGINNTDALLSGVQWAPGADGVTTLTFSFPWADTGSAAWSANYSGINEPATGSALTPLQQEAVRKAFALWSSVANITFTEVPETTTNVGDLRFGATNAQFAPAWASFPNETVASGGDVWISAARYNSPSSIVFYTFLHEIGHALGLKHTFLESNLGFGNFVDRQHDDVGMSLMSYTSGSFRVPGAMVDVVINSPSSPMILDIAAIQHMYGANMTYRTDNDTYDYGGNKVKVIETIWDAGGNDTISFYGFNGNATINLEPGSISIGVDPTTVYMFSDPLFSYIGIAQNCIIENAVGSLGQDSIVGNSVNNILKGDYGDDSINGMLGDDSLEGGEGNDTVIGNLGNDTVIGNEGNDVLFGDLGSDTLDGGEGNDTLTGGVGDDFLIGGEGKDTAVYAQAKLAYVMTAADMLEIKVASTQDGVDMLNGIERLEFSDVKLAFDLDGSAGHAALLMGCVAGKASLQNKELVGDVLAWIPDNSSLADVSQLLVNEGIVATVAGGTDNTSFVKLLMRNVLGSDSDVALVNSLTSLIDTGAHSQASMLTAASQLDANKIQVDLIGLSQTGLEYI